MTPVDFHIQPSGRIHVMLGSKQVGVIEEYPHAFRSPKGMLGTVGAYYRSFLPDDGAPSAPRPATSIKQARRRMLQWLAGWFDAAGDTFAPIAEAIATQALDERDG